MDITNLITPAVVIAILAYLVKFFGKAIADQKPFVDDRSWDIELNGMNFVRGLVISAVVGVALASYPLFHYTNWLINLFVFFVISTIGLSLQAQNIELAEKIYKIKIPFLSGTPRQLQKIIEIVTEKLKPFPSSFFEIFLFYLVTLSFYSNNLIWFAIMAGQTLLILNYTALNFSLKQIIELPKIDIFILGTVEPVKNVILLKVNSDNVRVRDGKKITIYNKNQILKLDLKLPKKITG